MFIGACGFVVAMRMFDINDCIAIVEVLKLGVVIERVESVGESLFDFASFNFESGCE